MYITIGTDRNGIDRVWAEGETREESKLLAKQTAIEYSHRRPDIKEMSFKTAHVVADCFLWE